MVSFCSASFTGSCDTSPNCVVNGCVKAAGICKTNKTAAGKFLGNPETTRMTAAGPPVDAAITTIGVRFPFASVDEGRRVGSGAAVTGRAAGISTFARVAVRITRTFAAIFNLRVSSSRTLRISRSIPLEGFGTKSIAPSSSARSVSAAPSRDSELTITIGRGFCDMISSVACRPSRWGLLMSMVITSGFNVSAKDTASRPSRACPATSSCGSELMISFSTLHMKVESSATNTRIFFTGGMSALAHRHAGSRAPQRTLGADQALHGRDQLIFLHRLGEKSPRGFFHRAIAVFGSGAGGDHQHRDFSQHRVLPQMRHQFVPVHARHLEVGHHKMASNLRHNFGGFQTIGSELHAIAGFLQHAAHEFPHADGIIRHHHYALVDHRVDRF